MTHISVLLHESIDGLDIAPGDIVVDGTLGSAGHSVEIAKRFGKAVHIIGIDMDAEALERSRKNLDKVGAYATLIQGNFRYIDAYLDEHKINRVNKILLDIGLSSNQLEESGRGFSFKENEPLMMTFKKDPKDDELTAYTIVNEWGADTLATIIKAYGEERYAWKIAQAIVTARTLDPIKTTGDLVGIILEATPSRYHHGSIHPATRTFQALRIAVNDELQALKEGLAKGFERLAPKGRMAVISFHSLEDRIVKNFFRDKHNDGLAHLVTKKPITPGEQELLENRRARSAKLRIIEKN